MQKRTQSRIMLKPLQMINSKVRDGKTLTLPPLPRGPPPSGSSSKKKNIDNNNKVEEAEDFEFI